jgi:hypothetical protein
VTIKSSAVDDSGNIEKPSAGVTVTTATSPSACPCTIWSAATTPAVASQSDPNAVELGVRFRSDVGGYITAIRFYKGSANTGTHIGNLWTNTGTLLATVTFAGETASGWQQATLSTPVAITANTTYVVSYYTPVGGYAVNRPYFATSGVNNPPLHALADGVDGPNGVYHYGASAFPTNTYQSSNYWIDVVFNTVANQQSDFAIAVSPSSQTVTQGGSTSYSVAISPTNGFTGKVNLSVSGLPSGASGSFNPNPATSSSKLSVTTSSSTPTGTYALTITAVSGSLTHTTTVSLVSQKKAK